jgi:hypothetical protein
MNNYQQAVRDVILKAVDREIPIYAAATMIEAIIMAELEGVDNPVDNTPRVRSESCG